MTKTFGLVLVLIALATSYSCSKKDTDYNRYPSYTMGYTNNFEVESFKIYVGSPTGGVDISDQYPNPSVLWGERMIDYNHPDSIVFVSETHFEEFRNGAKERVFGYEWKSDSLLIYNVNSHDWDLLCKGNKEELAYKMGFYIISNQTEGSSSYAVGQTQGEYSYDDMFHEDGFRSPEDLTNIGDTVTWCNIRYIYQKVSKQNN